MSACAMQGGHKKHLTYSDQSLSKYCYYHIHQVCYICHHLIQKQPVLLQPQLLVGWLEFSIPFQHKYKLYQSGYIRDEPQVYIQNSTTIILRTSIFLRLKYTTFNRFRTLLHFYNLGSTRGKCLKEGRKHETLNATKKVIRRVNKSKELISRTENLHQQLLS